DRDALLLGQRQCPAIGVGLGARPRCLVGPQALDRFKQCHTPLLVLSGKLLLRRGELLRKGLRRTGGGLETRWKPFHTYAVEPTPFDTETASKPAALAGCPRLRPQFHIERLALRRLDAHG